AINYVAWKERGKTRTWRETCATTKVSPSVLSGEFLLGRREFLYFVWAHLRVSQIELSQPIDYCCSHDYAGKPFVIRRHDIPRRVLGCRLLDHLFVCFHVVVPKIALCCIIGRKLPVLQWIINPLKKS